MMTETRMTVAELLAAIDRGWGDFEAYLGTLTPAQLTGPRDPAGWSAQDHAVHIADYERSLIPFLDRGDRLAVLGVDAETWASRDWDKINAIMQQRSKDLSVEAARAYRHEVHQALVERIQKLTDAELYQPFHYYQPQTSYDTPAIELLQDDTYRHYEEHTPWIAEIVTQTMSKAELLAKIEQGWNDFNAFLMTLTPTQVTIPTDAAGWRAIDHVIHLADWENGMLGLLNHQDRAAAMGVDKATWLTQDFDKINAILQARSRDKTLEQARDYVMDIHQRFVAKLESMSDEELHRSYEFYQPDSGRKPAVIKWVQMNTYRHYAEHTPWIAAIAADMEQYTKAALMSKVQAGWDELNTFLDSLTPAQKTQPTDAGGWSVKDHVMHLAIWEDGLTALLDKQDRHVRMGIDDATWSSGDDAINAVIQQRYQDLTWAEVEARRQAIHATLVKQIEGLSEATLHGAYGAYNPNSKSTWPVYEYISATTFHHYADHLPWMAAIAAKE